METQPRRLFKRSIYQQSEVCDLKRKSADSKTSKLEMFSNVVSKIIHVAMNLKNV